MNSEEVATEFAKYYYQMFDTNREGLCDLYQEESMLTFEGTQHQGAQDIVEKLVSLPFKKVEHDIQTLDCQPTVGGLLVFVSGALKVDDDNEIKFSQVFCLCELENSPGNFYVLNDMFRLNYG
eukprot:TRINITY_DN2109_c2_g1_i1.p1 TRINITY_DN2109_c2_g1~~TRINITY_DN2109_c2_g1_i1.p1  ORF type:complete len:123 (+),score=42.30 TRINITY_DN2109_c2_g1_i1:65-433(+)